MIVPLTLLVATLLARVAGWAGVGVLDAWPAAVRVGLAAMFLLTATAHFNSMRHDLVKMMPPGVPAPMAMVYFTGICEIAGACGLLIPATRRAAAIALIIFLICILPANIYAAQHGVPVLGKPATPLKYRIPLQLLFIALIAWSGFVN